MSPHQLGYSLFLIHRLGVGANHEAVEAEAIKVFRSGLEGFRQIAIGPDQQDQVSQLVAAVNVWEHWTQRKD